MAVELSQSPKTSQPSKSFLLPSFWPDETADSGQALHSRMVGSQPSFKNPDREASNLNGALNRALMYPVKSCLAIPQLILSTSGHPMRTFANKKASIDDPPVALSKAEVGDGLR